MKPTVAVIIPVYNAAATIIEAVDSVTRQSFNDLVIIAVDDGSTDNSLALLNVAAASRGNVLILSHENRGAAYSRNRGIKFALEQGIPFVAFLDADDVWHKDKLILQMNALESYPDAAAVVTSSQKCVEVSGQNVVAADNDGITVIEEFFDVICQRDFFFPPASCLAKTCIFVENPMYDVRFPCGEDFLPFLYIAYGNLTVLYIDKPLYVERVRRDSLQRRGGAVYHGYNARVTAIEEMILLCRRSDEAMTEQRLSVLLRAKDSYLSGMIYGARRYFSYPIALVVAVKAFRRYADKKPFFIEFAKTLLYPLRISAR